MISWKASISSILILSSTIFAALVFGLVPPGPFANFLILLLFIYPLILVALTDRSKTEMTFFLLAAPIVPVLLITGVTEPGLYGYDPYFKSLPAFKAILEGQIDEAIGIGDRPGFYYLPIFLQTILGGSTEIIAKYTPLFTLGGPVLLFVTLCRYMEREPAFLAAFAVSSTRTMLSFHTKFVNETLGIFLIIVAVTTIAIIIPQHRRVGVGLLAVLTGLCMLTHHYSSALFTLFILVWAFSPYSLRPLRFHQGNTLSRDVFALATAIGFFSTFLWFTPEVTGHLLSIGLETLFGVDSIESGAGLSSSPDSILDLIARLSILPLVVFCLLVALGALSKQYYPDRWFMTWSIVAGILGAVYAATLFAGRVIPLDPIRILLPFVIFVVAAAVLVLSDNECAPEINMTYRRTFAMLLVAIFIVTQIAALSPASLVDTAEPSSPDTDRSRPLAEFYAAEWSGEYTDDVIYDRDFGLWRWGGANGDRPEYDNGKCGGVIRPERTYYDRPVPNPRPHDVVFDAGGIQLTRC